MSFGFLGIQFGFGLQNANVSRIFQTLGADIDDIPLLWIAAPVTGLIVQPIIGHMSDKTWGRLGRRRPFFLVGAILASIALIIMPNSPTLWFAAGMLWIMDASINISMEPFRAFVGDMLPDEQRTIGFTMQSFFIGIGAFVASWLPHMLAKWFHIPNTAPENEIPLSVMVSFIVGGGVFLLAVLWTVFSTREYSPEEMKQFEKAIDKKEKEITITEPTILYIKRGISWLLVGVILFLPVFYFNLEKELYILAGGSAIFGLLQLLSAQLIRFNKSQASLVSIITDLYRMPSTMARLAMVQFFSWFALFSLWIYAVPSLTAHLYGTSDTQSETYNAGANWIGGMMGFYNLFASFFGLVFIPWLAQQTSRKIAYMTGLLAGGLSLIALYFLTDPDQLIFCMIGIGLAWATILSMPYAILTGSLPQAKMGVYMGIFNYFIVIPQILAATILGFMVRLLFNNESIYALITGGISMIVAAVFVLFVKDKSE